MRSVHPVPRAMLAALAAEHVAALFAAGSSLRETPAGAPDGFKVQLLPDGEFASFDGRPGVLDGVTAKAWRLDAALASRVIERFRARGKPLVIDYDHQTLRSEQNGQPAPAAGWIADLAYVPDRGLFARVEWTARAAAAIDAGEYKFMSPVFTFDPDTGAVLMLRHAGLTNDPGLTELNPVALTHQPNPQEKRMDLLAQLLGIFGLPKDTKEADVVAAIAALKAKADGADTQIAALSARVYDPSKHVPLADHEAVKAQLATLTAKVTAGEVDQVVQAALAAGKILPPQEGWAREYGARDLAGLRAYIEKTPAIVADLTRQQTGGKKPDPDGGADGLTAAEREVALNMGISAEAFAKSKAALAAA